MTIATVVMLVVRGKFLNANPLTVSRSELAQSALELPARKELAIALVPMRAWQREVLRLIRDG